MDTLTFVCGRSEKDLVAAELYEANTLGLIEDEQPDGRWRLQAFFAEDADLAGLESKLAPYDLVRSAVQDTDWVELARAAWQPQIVGERFFLVPPWRDDAAPPGRIRLEMPPGTASGTGLHPSTQLALQALEILLRPGDCLLDLGTGSGILSAAAHLLGAGAIVACDVDGEATAAARDYLAANRVPALLFTGSCRSLGKRSVDVVVANIGVPAIAGMAPVLAANLKPGGRAALTGFTADQAPRLERPLVSAGLRVRETLVMAEWTCLIAVLEN